MIGLQARLMSQALRKLTGIVSKSKTCLVFINQIREKIGVMFGNPETTTGGRALKFYCSVRIGHPPHRTRSRKAKRWSAPALKGERSSRTSVPRPSGTRSSTSATATGLEARRADRHGLENKIVEKSGSWFSYGDCALGQGRENSKLFIQENPDLFAKSKRRSGRRWASEVRN